MTPTLLRRPLAALALAVVAVGGLSLPAHADDPTTVTGWGFNDYGQATVPSTLDQSTVTAVAAGYEHSLALTSDGKVTAWGYDAVGETDVPAGLADQTVTTIAAGLQHSMALTSAGKVVVWGDSSYSSGLTEVPTSLAHKTVTAISTRWYFDLALTSDGKVVAWGNNADGETDVPASLADKTVTAVSAGASHALALTSDGKVTGWGNNDYGQTNVPASLADKTVTAVSAGYQHSLALTSDGKVTGWGDNEYGQTTAPAALDDKTVVAISANIYGSMALASDGTITTWGRGIYGEDTVPSSLDGTFVTSLSSGWYHALALTGTARPTSLTLSGGVSVSGTPTVGQSLTAESTVTSTPSATTAGQWLRDGEAIDGATGSSYELVNADAGHQLSYRVTASKEGYDDASKTSDQTAVVDGGQITLPDPTISGDAVVDGTLVATVSGVDPSDADLGYSWKRGDDEVGTESSYRPGPRDVGHALTLTVTAKKAHFDDATSSTTTDTVATAAFTAGPTASISGTAKVGETLTAGAGEVGPEPDSLTYQWYADGTAIEDATGQTFELTSDQRHTDVTVEVTAVKDGYADASDVSDATGDVATELAPSLDLDAAKATIRRGGSTTLTWSSVDADTLTASGDWDGSRAGDGSVSVGPTLIGTATYTLSATNDNGTTTASATVTVIREAKALDVKAGKGRIVRGSTTRVTATGLDAGEAYTILSSGTPVATGTANDQGTVSRRITVPRTNHTRTVRIRVNGSETDRTGRDLIWVVARR